MIAVLFAVLTLQTAAPPVEVLAPRRHDARGVAEEQSAKAAEATLDRMHEAA